LSIMTCTDDLDDDSIATPATTTSLGDEESSSSSGRSKKFFCSEMPVSHVLAIGFVEALAFQFRMECLFRQCFSYMTSPSKWNLKRKRKDSGDFLLDDNGMLELQRRESRERCSGSDLSMEDRELIISSITPRDERLNMRRANSHLMVDVVI
jgi:hypothetical protein